MLVGEPRRRDRRRGADHWRHRDYRPAVRRSLLCQSGRKLYGFGAAVGIAIGIAQDDASLIGEAIFFAVGVVLLFLGIRLTIEGTQVLLDIEENTRRSAERRL
ncbi:hypothetical protein [Botrimarina sp.]|uniref:hypothetical protein n=1 Tax=Botrimarina sp. TaxID=2795802 RepID=UPI0032EEFC2A